MNRNENTKIILISDIRSKKQSILPFGLQLAKYLNAEVEIIHIVDARSQHGVPSTYSDSQSISAGPKMTHDKIIERELSEATIILDRVLSKEASLLNFPLKINTLIKEGRINNEVKNSVGNTGQCIVLINEEVDNYIFHSHKEIIELIKSTDAISMLVPPGIDFKLFRETVFITDFSNKFGVDSLLRTTFLLQKINPKITAVDVAKPARYKEKELKGNRWRQSFDNTKFQKIETLVLKGKDHSNTLQRYLNKEKPDLVIYSYRKLGFINRLFHKSFLADILINEEYPIIYMQ